MTDHGATVFLDKYKLAATESVTAVNNYRGLAIHALYVEPHERIADYATELVAPGGRILDLGSGSGALALRLTDLGYGVTACDAVQENFRLHGKVPFVQADLNSEFSTLFSDRFDAISATEIVEHLENPRHFMRQCRALLKPGGKVLISTPNIDSSISRAVYARTGNFRMFSEDYYRGDGHITPVSLALLTRVCDETGFRVTKVSSVGNLSYPGLSWWRMRLLAFLLRKACERRNEENDILVLAAERTRSD